MALRLLAPARAGWRHAWPATWAERLSMLTVLLLAAVLRGLFLNAPIRFDEAANALYYGDRSLLHALGGMGGNENHALASLSIWGSVRLFGWSEVATRLPTFLCGIAFCWAIYTGLRWYSDSEEAALAGASLAAVSPWLVFFSVNARGYIWQSLAVALLVPLVLAVWRGTSVPAAALGIWAGALTAAGALAARSMLVFAAGLFLGGALLIGTGRRRSEGLRFLAFWAGSAAVLTLALFSVAVAAHGSRGLLGIAPTLRQPLHRALADTASSYGAILPRLVDSAGERLFLVAYLVLLAGSLAAWRRVGPFAVLTLAVLAAGFGVTALIHLGLYPRVLLPLSGLLIPWLALAATALTGRRRPAYLLLLALVLAVWPAVWLRQDLMRLRDGTGDLPGIRPLARSLLDRPEVEKSILMLPPLYDVGVAFYFREAALSRAGIEDYDLGLDPARHCEFRRLIAFVPRGETLDGKLGGYRGAPWHPRLRRDQAQREVLVEPVGSIVRVPLAPCSQGRS